MKIKDIVNPFAVKQSKVVFHKSIHESRYAVHKELLALLHSSESGLITSCPALAADELELIEVILRRLRADRGYQPSPIATQLVVDVNARVWASNASTP